MLWLLWDPPEDSGEAEEEETADEAEPPKDGDDRPPKLTPSVSWSTVPCSDHRVRWSSSSTGPPPP